MSASSCVAYFGLRFDIGADEINQLEQRSDARQIAAQRAGLESYWANFGGEAERYVLFIGTQIAILGPENDRDATLPIEHLSNVASDTADRLRSTNMDGEINLHLVWLVDI